MFKLNPRSLEETESSPKTRARPRRRSGLRKLGVAGLMIAAVAAMSAPAQAADDAPNYSYDHLLPEYGVCGSAAEGDMSKTYSQWTVGAMCLVNEVRRKAGLDSYGTYANLLDSAYHNASDISVCQPDAFATRPDGTKVVHFPCGMEPGRYVKFPSGCAYSFNENIYIGSGSQGTARAAVTWWVRSNNHRPALLSREHTGQGLMYSGPTTYPGIGPDSRIWVQHMGHCI